MPATSNYLDNYFRHNLANASWMTSRWASIMFRSVRCLLPAAGNGTVRCEPLLAHDARIADVGLDFPTFNPLYKYAKHSAWWYATAPSTATSMWFDTIVKVDSRGRRVAATFHVPGVYVTEANFIPRPGAADEDDGLLLSVLYNSTADTSLVALLDGKTMGLVEAFALGTVIPYHSHGVACQPAGRCFTNP